ncbi:MAG: head decoration protein [Deltaproteobacteria bacterium]|nr:head decoration protein [Deltaproteobacteria bacterium]
MAKLLENDRLNDVLKWEMENLFSREKITILSGEDLPCGAVVGKVKTSCPTTGTADGGNTGDGTCTGVTAGAQVKLGTYILTCIAAAGNAGTFEVRDPDDITLGQATVAVAYTSEQIDLTLNDGAADFIVGDIFTIAVTAGSLKMVRIAFAAVDGSEDAHGFVIDDYDASLADLLAVAIIRDALINPDYLAWPMEFTSGGTDVPAVGDIVVGATSSDTGEIVKITLSSGSWAGGDAVGTLWLRKVSGEFQAENLDIDARSITNFAAIAAALKTVDNLAVLAAAGIIEREGA